MNYLIVIWVLVYILALYKEDKVSVTRYEKDENSTDDSEDDFSPTLAAMESEIKPKVLKTVNILTKEYNKLIKYQKEKLDCVLKSQNFSPTKEKRN